MTPAAIETAAVVIACAEIDAALAFYRDRLGFRLETVFPADDPAVATLSGHGLRLRLERGGAGGPGRLRLQCRDPAAIAGGADALTAPDGTVVEIVAAPGPLAVPPVAPSLSIARMTGDWTEGRAGMLYRDLIPDRQGGYAVASHIRIPGSGPVPDYVHFHRIRFQMIYCVRGRVRVVYEDQGPPFTMRAGDCVLQPPEIRHRVLESSDGLEVVEVGVPAAHVTCVDHALALPTTAVRPDRDFGGQRFVFHEAAGARWRPWRLAGFEARDTGIAAATSGLAGVAVVRPAGAAAGPLRHDAELAFRFVLRGSLVLEAQDRATHALAAGDAFVVPAGMGHALARCSADLEFLEVMLPAAGAAPVG